MRQLILLFIVLLMLACGGTTTIAPARSVDVDCNNDGIAEKLRLKEYVIGDFNGNGQKEYVAIYYRVDGKSYHDYILVGDATMDSINLEWYASNLVNEGDLNGDGADEIGMFKRGEHSSWGEYTVYTYTADGWRELVSISHSETWNSAPYQDLVRIDPNNTNSLIVKEIGVVDNSIVDVNVKIK